MKCRLTLAAAFVSSIICLDSAALTLEPLPGSTPQVTCLGCVFPAPIGVTVRDESGRPVAGVPVTFSALTGNGGVVDGTEYVESATVQSDAAGIAKAVIVPSFPGEDASVKASAPSAADTVFALASSMQHATTLVALSGSDQIAQAGTAFVAPWKVRVLDAAGRPVPNTLVAFYAGDGDVPGTASATFDASEWGMGTASNWDFAIADANGVAVSATPRAGATVGDNEGSYAFVFRAIILDDPVPNPEAYFPLHVVAQPIRATGMTLVSAPPASLAIGDASAIPYVVRVTDASGAPAAGTPVYFTVDGACADFLIEGPEQMQDAMTVADANGLARSPLIYAYVPMLRCAVAATAGGVADAIRVDVHTFDPMNVVVTAHPDRVVTRAGSLYRVTLEFSESGMPVHPASLEGVESVRARLGPPADVQGEPSISIADSSAFVDLRANRVPGIYELLFTYRGPVQVTVPVLQLPH